MLSCHENFNDKNKSIKRITISVNDVQIAFCLFPPANECRRRRRVLVSFCFALNWTEFKQRLDLRNTIIILDRFLSVCLCSDFTGIVLSSRNVVADYR